MEFKELLSISGVSGLYQMVAQRNDGLLVRPVKGGRTIFFSGFRHNFTPLESITIYTVDEENLELKEVFLKMKEMEEELPVVSAKAPAAELKAYFKKIAPNHDEERVYVSDIIKVIKWYNELNDARLLPDILREENSEEGENQKADEPEEVKAQKDNSASEENTLK